MESKSEEKLDKEQESEGSILYLLVMLWVFGVIHF